MIEHAHNYLLNLHILIYLSLCVVTTFFIPTAKQMIGGLEALGMISRWESTGSLLPFLLSLSSNRVLDVFERVLPSIIQLERTSPVFWFKTRSTPSIPPTTNDEMSLCKCAIEYTTFGLTLYSHRLLIVLRKTEITLH